MTRTSRLASAGWPLPPGDTDGATDPPPEAAPLVVNGTAVDVVVVEHSPTELAPSQLDDGPGAGALLPPSQPVPVSEPVDYAVVRLLRERVATRLMPELSGTQRLSDLPDEEVRSAIRFELETWLAAQHTAGEPLPAPAEEAALEVAVFNLAHGLGRLQPLLDAAGVDNITITGCDNVWLQDGAGDWTRGPAIADSDEDLLDDLRFWTMVHGRGRSLSEKDCMPEVRLPDGSRMAMIIDVVHRPRVAIRRHTAKGKTLEDLVELGALNPVLVEFLTALVRARMNVLIVGQPSAGKTTMLRAMLGLVPPREEILTIEESYELQLHTMPERHARVVALEGRTGGPEVDADGRKVGEVTLATLGWAALRQMPDRTIVGEVRGAEVEPLMSAMETGNGSMCTTHGDSALLGVKRIARLDGAYSGAGPEFALARVASSVHYVIHIASRDQRARGGRLHRYVDEILEVLPGEDGMPAYNQVFGPGPDRRAVHATTPARLEQLVDAGLDPSVLVVGQDAWPTRLDDLALSW